MNVMKTVIVQLVLSHWALVSSYNLDVHNAAVFQESHPSNVRKSYFGYSVALSTSDDESLLVVGAPRANSSRDEKRELTEPGAVYLCTTAYENNCSEWPVDGVDYDYYYRNPNPGANKNHAWLGATIQVTPYDESVLMVCSPRWSYGNFFGVCYSKTLKVKTIFYTREDTQHYIELEHAMVGHSLYMKPDDEQHLIKGYSVVPGHFFGHDDVIHYAYGMPRSNAVKGEIKIFYLVGQNAVIVETKVGSQVGEYFGFTLAACDVNNDGRDDLFVGAPLWSDDGDEGRVAAYLSKNQRSLFEEHSIQGTISRARFGSTIVCLGDLDQDGYEDVAIGAPYEDGHGAVYIFNGGPDGLTSYSQRIRGSELQSGVRGFGVSISGPRDVDGNGYVDIAIGAYLSGHAVLFRSRPVVILKLTKLAPPDNLSLTENSTQLRLDVCAFYTGSFVSNTLAVNITLVFNNRVYINEKSLHTYHETEKSIAIDQETCMSVRATLVPSDLLKPIKVDAEIKINDDSACPNCPVINRKLSRLTYHKEMPFTLECGKKSICISDLIVEIISYLEPKDQFVLGSKSNVSLDIVVYNTKEPAYYSCLYIDIPDPIQVLKMSTECYEQSKLQGSLRIQCKIVNPLRKEVTIPIVLDMSAIQNDDTMKIIHARAETQSQESYIGNNKASLNISFFSNASFAINGKANEKLYTYSGLEETSSVESIAFEHVYEIQKFGISPIEEVNFLLKVPTHWNSVQVSMINKLESQVDDVQYKSANESTIPLSKYTFRFKEENMTLLSRENQTYYLNCTTKEVECQTFLWTLGPFRKPQSSAKVTVQFELLLSNQMAAVIKNKDILFLSEATVKITKPDKTMETSEKRPNYKQVSTFFVYRPKPETIAAWIIVVSVLLGVVLVILATVMLYKLGFFKRKRIEVRKNLSNQEISEELFN